jgi:hypothetical protein
MKPNIHPEIYRAMQSARHKDISRGAARRRPEDHRERNGWVARRGRMAAFFERALRDASATLFGYADAPKNIHVNVPPLADNPPLSK